jgi:hypothetical protein
MLLEKLDTKDKKEKAKKKPTKLPFSNSKDKSARKSSDPAELLRPSPMNIESESDQLDNSSLKDEAKKNSQPLINNFIRKKDGGGKKIPENFVLWLRIDDYDAVPIKVDPTLTVCL